MGNEWIQCSAIKTVYIGRERRSVAPLFSLFGRTERPDRSGTNRIVFDVDGHHRRWVWTPMCSGMYVQNIPFVPIRLAKARILHGPKHVFTQVRNEWPRAASFRSARSRALWRESRHALSDISNDGAIDTTVAASRIRNLQELREPLKPSTRSRTAGSTANRCNAPKRMSTRASSGEDVALVDTGAFKDRELNGARRLRLFANTVIPDCLHSREMFVLSTTHVLLPEILFSKAYLMRMRQLSPKIRVRRVRKQWAYRKIKGNCKPKKT